MRPGRYDEVALNDEKEVLPGATELEPPHQLLGAPSSAVHQSQGEAPLKQK